MKYVILVAEDRDSLRQFLAEALASTGHEVLTAADGNEAWRIMGERRVDLLLTDLKMPGLDGLALIQRIRDAKIDTASIVLTAHGTIDNAVAAVKLGAFDYLTKPLDSPAALREVVRRALADRMHSAPVGRAGSSSTTEMIFADPVMVELVRKLDRVAPTDATVLLTGESGTGKELAARRIHQRSKRSDAPFIAVNCAAISSQLMESEMFGHEKGSFTGATEMRRGRFELADGGTLFLDEVGELPLQLQAKLLRVLQENSFERLGGSETLHVNVRMIAATNRDLLVETAEGRFREDLYHRLSVFPLRLPALRERRADITALCELRLADISDRAGVTPLSLSTEALKVMQHYAWPGNIRELGNALERAAILCENGVIEPEHLGLASAPEVLDTHPAATGTLRDGEKEAIRQALKATDGHRKKAAELLGMGLRTLYTKLKDYDLD